MTEFIMDTTNNYGYIGIVLLVLFEIVFPPIPSELVLTFGGFMTTQEGGTLELPGVIAAATLGSLLGAAFLYFFGYLVNYEKIETLLEKKWIKWLGFKISDIEKTIKFFNKYSAWAVFLGRCVPVVRSLISIPAGMAKMNFLKFTLYTVVGAALWNAILISFGAALGKNWEKISVYVGYYSNVTVILLFLIIIALGIGFILKRRKS